MNKTKIISILLIFVALNGLNIGASDDTDEMPVKDQNFLKGFKAGVLGTGVDCENIKFLPNGTFLYKFTGDCKGWGRTLQGTWKKQDNKLQLSAELFESKEEGEIGCAGSYYHQNTPKEKAECFSKYKEDTLKEFGVFPAKFELTGAVWITSKLTVAVKLESYLVNNAKKGKIKGLMHFSDEAFGLFRKDRP